MNDFGAVVQQHSDAVWRTAYRLLNDYEDALDCYQETFLAALRLAAGEPVLHWRTLLVRIATRRSIDRLRRRYQNEQAADGSMRFSDRRSLIEAPDARAQGEELRQQVRRALATLPPEQAEAFWLRHLEQLSPSDVAEQMGIEPGHVRVLVHRAAVGLRAILGPSYGFAPVSEELP